MEEDDILNNETFSYSDSTEEYDNNLTEFESPPFSYPLNFRIICYILYNLVFVLGLVGNLLVFYTIHYTHPRMKTVQNYFLGNLALGDLLIVILCVPTGYISVLWQYWPFGEMLCLVLTPVKAVGVFVSSYTLIALAIDRYLAILYPLKMGLTMTQCKWGLSGIWVGAIITAAPVAMNSRIEVHIETGEQRCGEYGWESHTHELCYSLTLLFLQYLFPVIVLIYTYTRISFVVWGHHCDGSSSHTTSSLRSGGMGCQPLACTAHRGKKKTLILSLSVVTGYTLAWLPYNIIYMIYKHGPEAIMDADFFPYLFLTCHWLAMAHTMFNPVIYFWINSRFRRAFMGVVQSKCPCLVVGEIRDSWNTSSVGVDRRLRNSLKPNNTSGI